MWLIHIATFELEEFFDSNTPAYAILSHTWGNDELSFTEVQDLRGVQAHPPHIQAKAGYRKAVNFCTVAQTRGYNYGWIDTCCIDKRSSADLSENINSMFRYYHDAGECLIYLSDVPAIQEKVTTREQQLTAIGASRWFTRGWTLQELIAPRLKSFFSQEWAPIDPSGSFEHVVGETTGIARQLLRNRNLLSIFCTAERLSWAAKRETTRGEDRAYSLMGLFDIHMPVLYGEGGTRAFRRLQEEIIRTSFDQSIFVWRGDYKSSGLFAKSPSDFACTPRLSLWAPVSLAPFAMTNVGLSLRINITDIFDYDREWLPADIEPGLKLGVLGCDVWDGSLWVLLIILLKPVPNASFYVNGNQCKAYRRVRCGNWLQVDTIYLPNRSGPECFEDVLVLEDEHFQLVTRAVGG